MQSIIQYLKITPKTSPDNFYFNYSRLREVDRDWRKRKGGTTGHKSWKLQAAMSTWMYISIKKKKKLSIVSEIVHVITHPPPYRTPSIAPHCLPEGPMESSPNFTQEEVLLPMHSHRDPLSPLFSHGQVLFLTSLESPLPSVLTQINCLQLLLWTHRSIPFSSRGLICRMRVTSPSYRGCRTEWDNPCTACGAVPNTQPGRKAWQPLSLPSNSDKLCHDAFAHHLYSSHRNSSLGIFYVPPLIKLPLYSPSSSLWIQNIWSDSWLCHLPARAVCLWANYFTHLNLGFPTCKWERNCACFHACWELNATTRGQHSALWLWHTVSKHF